MRREEIRDCGLLFRLSLDENDDGEVRCGADIYIGTKIAYSKTAEDKDFLPTNLRLGAGFTFWFDENNSLSFQFDANKLLVPTPPVYLIDSNGHPAYDDSGDPVIAEGKDPNVSVCKGMIGFRIGIFAMDFGLRIPFEYMMKDAYTSIYYLRTSIAFSSLK